MVKKLRTTCFFGCQKMEKTKEEGHRKHILTNSLKIKDYRWKNVKSWWPIEKGGNHSSTVIFRRGSTSEWVSEWMSEWVRFLQNASHGMVLSWKQLFQKNLMMISERYCVTKQLSRNLPTWCFDKKSAVLNKQTKCPNNDLQFRNLAL